MPDPAQRSDREFLPSANQALAELEQATGKPVLIQEDQHLKVLATIHRAGAEESCHVLRVKGSSDHISDYLITFECRMALRDGQEPRKVVMERRQARERVISEVEKLHRQLDAPTGSDAAADGGGGVGPERAFDQ